MRQTAAPGNQLGRGNPAPDVEREQ